VFQTGFDHSLVTGMTPMTDPYLAVHVTDAVKTYPPGGSEIAATLASRTTVREALAYL
jgi:hypothetical protein